MKKKNKHYGFTLIELMITLSIIGILITITIPAYQKYIIRTKLIEINQFSAATKIFVWEEYLTAAQMPPDNSNAADSIELTITTSNLVKIATYKKINNDSSSVEVTLHNLGLDADNKTINFIFLTDGTKIELDCRGGTIQDIYRPAICRSNN